VHCSKKTLFDHVVGLSQKRGWHSAGKTISRSSAKKRRDPLYRERERIAVRERVRRLRAAPTTPGERGSTIIPARGWGLS
jgi:hypothetical protein